MHRLDEFDQASELELSTGVINCSYQLELSTLVINSITRIQVFEVKQLFRSYTGRLKTSILVLRLLRPLDDSQ